MTIRKISAMIAASAAALCFCACENSAESGASSAESSSAAAVTTTATAEQPAATITAVMTEAADESSETETQPAEPQEIDLQGRAIEYCDGARDVITRWYSYMDSGDYEQATALMTKTAAKALDIDSYSETETGGLATVEFGKCTLSKSGDGANISVETNVSYDSQADTVMQRRILVHFDGLDYIISEITDEGISLYG